ncbi:MAG: hypothetical protein AB7H96_00860 [Vicinamibacterales bacterium]
MKSLCSRLLGAFALTALLVPHPAAAQGWTFDARKIALGGAGDGNLASGMAGDRRPYSVIVMPFGIFRVLENKDRFDPEASDFDPIRLAEDIASPLHYMLATEANPQRAAFVNDIRNARLSRDLNVYRGFVPAQSLTGEGLADPTVGYTFKVSKPPSGGFQGIRVGAGPYLPVRSRNEFDPDLLALLSSSTPVVARNTAFDITSQTRGALGLAVAVGYRAHFPWGGSSAFNGKRDGLYVAADYDYIKAFRLEDVDLAVRLATDSAGLITMLPSTTPIRFTRQTSSSGTGRAINMGVLAVAGPFEVGFGARGLGNRISWDAVESTTYSLRSLTSGDSDFTESPTLFIPTLDTEIPVEYRFNGAYHAEKMSVLGDIRRGFNGTSMRAGVEARTRSLEVRGGLRYINQDWNPAVGAGLNLGERVGIDVSLFTTTANIERRRDKGIAASLRLMGRPKDDSH